MSDDARRERNRTAQLKREIAYYTGVAIRTASRDRIRMAHVAIAVREQRLREAVTDRSTPKEELR
jgi:hypothetical protein